MTEAHKKAKRIMKLGKTCGFRPDDPELVDMFNLSMEATGADLTELAVRSIKHGLQHAVRELLEARKQAQAKLNLQVKGQR